MGTNNGNGILKTIATVSTVFAVFTVIYANAKDPHRLTQLEKLTEALDNRIHRVEIEFAIIGARLDSIKETLEHMNKKLDGK